MQDTACIALYIVRREASPYPMAFEGATPVISKNQNPKKKKKLRVRGEKPRERSVLPQHERAAEVSFGRGRVRQLDLKPSRNAEMAVPRRMRALFAAKAAIEAKAAAAAAPLVSAVNVRAAASGSAVARGSEVREVRGEKMQKSNGGVSSAAGEEEISLAVKEKRKTARQIVVEAVRKNSHQHGKKKAYYERREARAIAKKERAKLRRRKRKAGDSDSDIDVEEWNDDNDDNDEAGGLGVGQRSFSYGRSGSRRHGQQDTTVPRFGEQAQAPPKLNPVLKKTKR